MPEETNQLEAQEETSHSIITTPSVHPSPVPLQKGTGEATEAQEADEPSSDEAQEENEEHPTLEPISALDTEAKPETDSTFEPLADLKALIQTDPERAIERTAQVEAGLKKLQAQKQQAESFILGIDSVFKGLERGEQSAVADFERVLFDNTGLTYQSLVDLKKGDQSSKEDSKISQIERKLKALEEDRAAAKWIADVGVVVAHQVARETGLEFSPEQLWLARPHLPRGATAEDVRKAVMRVDPDAYDLAAAKRDGAKSPVPRSATMPTGRSGPQRTYDHTPQGFLQAYEAKRARGQ